jgi:hypothetical protein
VLTRACATATTDHGSRIIQLAFQNLPENDRWGLLWKVIRMIRDPWSMRAAAPLQWPALSRALGAHAREAPPCC